MAADRWPLFEHFPALWAALDPIALCRLPTPVEPLATLSPNAWIKRDDISANEYGGNKMRKLEFVLRAIRQRGARHVITLGAQGSNAAVATAMVCQSQALDFTLISFPQPDSETVRHNQAMLQHYGANTLATPALSTAIGAWALHPARLSRRNFFMMAGCSTPEAVYAYINAALELARQVQSGHCPMPAHLVVPAGSCSTAAGLSIGASLALPGCRVHAIQVAPARLGPIDICSLGKVHHFREKAWQRLRREFPTLQAHPDDNLTWHDSYLGEGYGENTLQATAAISGAQRLGISLEHTYSGKAFAAFCDVLNKERGAVLFWNTFNSQPTRVRVADPVTDQLRAI